MDAYRLRNMLLEIDRIPVEDIERRYPLLNSLFEEVKDEAKLPGAFEAQHILTNLLNSIDTMSEDDRIGRYFRMISMMIFLKRQALLDPSYQTPTGIHTTRAG